MDVLIVGSGGREHALLTYLKKSPDIETMYVLPGNAGMENDAVIVDISATDIEGIVSFAVRNKIGFAVVAPDDPLVMGAVDRLEEVGIPCFGPNAVAAKIEGSKSFAKELMKKYGIPTASYKLFDSYDKALSHIANARYPTVIKADGLALGKGVFIAKDKKEARDALDALMKRRVFGTSGDSIVIEEFLQGPEVSVLCFTDGKTILPMVSSMDHKGAFDGNKGPNTGGMGAVAPNRYFTAALQRRSMEEIFLPTMHAMNAEQRTFKGCLYFGLILTEQGPRVIEYNCRFGDPETQAVLPLLETDFFTIMRAVAEERLSDCEVRWSDKHACCVVLASGGYPGKYETGYPIEFGNVGSLPETIVFHAGTKRKDGRFVTNGGRVLGVTSLGATREEAIERSYRAIGEIRFEQMQFRSDIGKL